MEHLTMKAAIFPRIQPTRIFAERPVVEHSFPIQSLQIDWDRLIAKRPYVLETVEDMPLYLLKREVLALLARESDPEQRLILDLMWSTGARVSECLALTPASFVDDGYDYSVRLRTLKQRPGRPSKKALARSQTRFVPINDSILLDRIQTHLRRGQYRQSAPIFQITRQTVNRRLKTLVREAGGADFNVVSHTFRHSFAVHMLLHGRPLKYISKLLGHRSVDSTEIYTNVLIADGAHFMEGVEFH